MVASRERECSAPFKVEVPNTLNFDKRTEKNYIIMRTTINLLIIDQGECNDGTR